MNQKIAIIVVVLIIIIALILFFVARLRNEKEDIPVTEYDFTSVYYSHGGSELGESYSIYLRDNVVTVSECKGNGYETVTEKYNLNSDTYEEIKALLISNDVYNWKDLENSEIMVLDGPVTSFSVSFDDFTFINVNSNKELPEGGWTCINKIKELMEACISEENIYTPEPEVLLSYYHAIVATVGGDRYKSITLYRNSDDTLKVCYRSKGSDDTEESMVAYTVDSEILDAIYDLAKENKYGDWKKLKDGTALDGAEYSLMYIDEEGNKVNANSEKMPENGVELLEDIPELISKYVDEKNRIYE